MSLKDRVEEQIDNFSWNVYAIRSNRGITQYKLAEMAGISHVSVSRIESSDEGCNMWTALSIADALDVDITSLFNERVELGLLRPYMGRPTKRRKKGA